jgi:hypothetical protein
VGPVGDGGGVGMLTALPRAIAYAAVGLLLFVLLGALVLAVAGWWRIGTAVWGVM